MDPSTRRNIAVPALAAPPSRRCLTVRKRWLSSVVLVLGLLGGGCGGTLTSPPAAASAAPPAPAQYRSLPDTSDEDAQSSEGDEEPERASGVRVSRAGDGPLEVVRAGRGVVARVPVEGGGRVTLDLTAEEAADLADALSAAAQ